MWQKEKNFFEKEKSGPAQTAEALVSYVFAISGRSFFLWQNLISIDFSGRGEQSRAVFKFHKAGRVYKGTDRNAGKE